MCSARVKHYVCEALPSTCRFGSTQSSVVAQAPTHLFASSMASTAKGSPWSDETTKPGALPPFEVAKAYAFDMVLRAMEQRLGQSCWMLLGVEKRSFIAKHLRLKGGGHPGCTAVENAIAKCKSGEWHPGR